MPDRKLIVEITGDTRGLERSLKTAGRETDSFGKKLAGFGKVAAAGAAAGIGLTAVELGKNFVEAAVKAQEETGKLNQAFKNAGMSADKMKGFVDRTEAAQRKLGFTNSDTRDALAKFITAGDSAAAATKDLGLASDYARFKGIGLADASLALVRAHAGNLRALKSLGVAIPTVTDNMDALRIAHQRAKTAMTDAEKQTAKNKDAQLTYSAVAEVLTKKVGGQADEFSKSAKGGMEEFHAQMHNLEEQAGAHLLPAVASVSGALGDLMGIMGGTGSVSDKLTKAFERVGVSAKTSQELVAGIGTAFTILKPIIEIAFKLFEGMALVMVTPMRVVIAFIHGDWQKGWDDLIAPVRFAIGLVKDAVGGIAEKAWDAFNATFQKVFVSPFHAAWEAAGNWLGGKVDDFAGFFGSLPGKIADALKGGTKNALGKIKEWFNDLFGWLPGWAKDILGIHSPSTVFAEIGGHIVGGLIKGLEGMAGKLKDKVQQVIGSPIDWVKKKVSDSLGGPLGAGGHGSGTAAANQLIAYNQIKSNYPQWLDAADMNALTQLWNQESGWNQFAKNPKSGAYGIPQALPPTKMPYKAQEAGGSDPSSQIAWGLGYIHGTYGSPENAWSGYYPRGGWYAKGGIFTSPSVIGVGEAGPEAVIPLNRAGGFGGPQTIQFVLDGRVLAEAFRREDGRYRMNNALTG